MKAWMTPTNTDPKASIFDVSDLIVVGDYKEILPALIEEIEE